ncbi:MAG: VWA domain-containing protein [Crocinitomicaceae bacterium]
MLSSYNYKIKPILIATMVFELLFWAVFFIILYILNDQVEAFRIENREWWYLFLIIPIILVLFIGGLWWKNKAIKNLANQSLLPHLMPPISSTKVFTKFILFRTSLAFFIIALLNPQFGKGTQKAISEGIEIVVALDISNSMRALDLDENRDRLKIAQMSIDRLINDLHGDKIGIVIFAGEAFIQVPLTSDYGSAKTFLSALSPNMLSNQGTNLSEAIGTSLSAFDLENGINKTIIVISDGEDHEGAAVQMAQEAYSNGIIVNTVGMGTTKGTVIPNYVNGKRVGLKKDAEGNTVTTKINTAMLQEIAQAGGGIYAQAQGNYVNLDPLLTNIKGIEKSEIESKLYTDYEDQFQWFIGLGLILLILFFIFTEKPNKLLRQLVNEDN